MMKSPAFFCKSIIDEDGNEKKADMFHKQTIRAKNQVDRVEISSVSSVR